MRRSAGHIIAALGPGLTVAATCLSPSPMALLFFQRPVWIVLIYSIAATLFTPFLAGTLLVLNNRWKLVGTLRNNLMTNLFLLLTLALFSVLFIREIADIS